MFFLNSKYWNLIKVFINFKGDICSIRSNGNTWFNSCHVVYHRFVEIRSDILNILFQPDDVLFKLQ